MKALLPAGHETDAQVATRMGFIVKVLEAQTVIGKAPGQEPTVQACHPLPRYSTDVDAAMGLVDELCRLSYFVAIFFHPTHVSVRVNHLLHEQAPTVSLAICRAVCAVEQTFGRKGGETTSPQHDHDVR